MIIYPAIDLRGGKVVRLKEGDPKQQTTFSQDPVATARRWIAEGAQWIHMVNLDGAFNAANSNQGILEAVASLGVPIQFGGGLRRIEDIADAIQRGATRVVLGTVALEQPQVVDEALASYGPDRICIGLDARDGRITTHGWTSTREETPVELGRAMAARGVRHALFTDVSRDGSLQGANIEHTIELAQQTGLQVIASGGIHRLEEIERLAASGCVAGVIIGMALYTEQFTLEQALTAAEFKGDTQ